MEKYRAATWWFLEDREVTLTPADVTRIVLEHADMRKGFGDVRLPADQVTTLRAFGLRSASWPSCGATNNWFRIGREVDLRRRARHRAGTRRGRVAGRTLTTYDHGRAP